MKAKHFIYSQQQRDIILSFDPNKKVNKVFCNGTFVPYTEMNSTGDSNFEDANHLGIHPQSWVRVNGVIQDYDLKNFIEEIK